MTQQEIQTSRGEGTFVEKQVDMPPDVVDSAKRYIAEAFSSTSNEQEIAKYVKKHFDEEYGPIWHCVVGNSFGANGTHETNHFLYIYYDQTAIQLWKCG